MNVNEDRQRQLNHERHERHENFFNPACRIKETLFHPVNPVHPRLRRASPVKTGFSRKAKFDKDGKRFYIGIVNQLTGRIKYRVFDLKYN